MARVVRSAALGRVVCLCVVVVGLVAGCMALPKVETAVFQDPLLEHKGTVPLKAGMMTLTDARPAAEREGRGAIEDFAERVTVVMLTDFSEARVFTSIEHAKTERPADVILRGEIRSFRWTPRYNYPPFIPGLGILAAFGVPVSVATMDVEITLELVDPKKAQTIASYTKAARQSQSHFVYRFQDFQAGSDREGNSAFRRVAVDLQTAILEDRERIVEALK